MQSVIIIIRKSVHEKLSDMSLLLLLCERVYSGVIQTATMTPSFEVGDQTLILQW